MQKINVEKVPKKSAKSGFKKMKKNSKFQNAITRLKMRISSSNFQGAEKIADFDKGLNFVSVSFLVITLFLFKVGHCSKKSEETAYLLSQRWPQCPL